MCSNESLQFLDPVSLQSFKMWAVVTSNLAESSLNGKVGFKQFLVITMRLKLIYLTQQEGFMAFCFVLPTQLPQHSERRQTCEKLKVRPKQITAKCSDVQAREERWTLKDFQRIGGHPYSQIIDKEKMVRKERISYL